MTLDPALARAVAAMPAADFVARVRAMDGKDRRAAMVHRFRYDQAGFLRYLFPERFDLAWSPVHEAFLADEVVPWRERNRPANYLDVAPRGGAKSSIKSFGDVVHRVVYGLEVCVLVFSTGYRLAEDLVRDLYDVLGGRSDGADALAELFPGLTVTGTQTAFVAMVPGTGEPLGTQIAAKSFGGTVRGHKFRGCRPSYFVLDDTVNPKHLKNPEQRDASWKFLNADILRAGFRYTEVRMVGTIQHRDDLVSRGAASPRWRTRRWKNLLAWPARTDLWERCRALWANLDDQDRVGTAFAFYEAHRDAMHEGAEVLWEAGRPLFSLMCDFWANPAAFYAEDQNEPRAAEASIFDVERIRRCSLAEGRWIRTSRGERVDLRTCAVSIWMDHASGKPRRDFGAVAVVASTPAGWSWVLECELYRKTPSLLHEALWGAWERYRTFPVVRVGYDATGTQGLLEQSIEREREDRRRAGLRPWDMRAEPVSLTQGKDAIAGLEPILHHGWMEIADTVSPAVIEQLADYPHGHDDGPDAIHKALTRNRGMPEVVRGFTHDEDDDP